MNDDDTLSQTTLIRPAAANGDRDHSSGFTLTVLRGGDQDYGALFSFDSGTTIIGRSHPADLLLHDRSISKLHCRIVLSGGKDSRSFLIEDLESTNGTRHNGVLITSPSPLYSGDRIEIGDTVLRFNTRDDLDSEYQSHLLRLATTDPLTSLLNKAALFKELERMLKHASRYNRPLSLLMIDLDHFKQVNDRWGHLAGDQVLQQLALHLRTVLRQQDIAGRFGGEEFTIILPETSLPGATCLADRLRDSIASRSFEVNGSVLSITVSIGVAQRETETLGASSLLEQADRALYQAKNKGRNQVYPFPVQ